MNHAKGFAYYAKPNIFLGGRGCRVASPEGVNSGGSKKGGRPPAVAPLTIPL